MFFLLGACFKNPRFLPETRFVQFSFARLKEDLWISLVYRNLEKK